MDDKIVIAMMVVAIVMIIGISIDGIVDKVLTAKRFRHDALALPNGAEHTEIAERQQMIEDRVRVLERIATDRGSLLADEIEALRSDTLAITKVKDTA
jgi:hypothetical protein